MFATLATIAISAIAGACLAHGAALVRRANARKAHVAQLAERERAARAAIEAARLAKLATAERKRAAELLAERKARVRPVAQPARGRLVGRDTGNDGGAWLQ
jgi:hypothetical protein